MKVQRFCSLLLILALAAALAVPAMAAAPLRTPVFLDPHDGSLTISDSTTLVAINTDLRTEDDPHEDGGDTLTNSSFSATLPDAAAPQTGAFRVTTDASGNTLTQCERPQEQLTPIGTLSRAEARRADKQSGGGYSLGEHFNLESVYQLENDETGEIIFMPLTDSEMVCRYIGTHCTVWGSTSDHEKIQLQADDAAQIGQAFDETFDQMTAAFGDFWYDVDGDGKIAIMCYDIDREYKDGFIYQGNYTAGYYAMSDQIAATTDDEGDACGILNGIMFGGTYTEKAIDCIRIDTYPLMGADVPLSEVSECYPTLIHEFQHLLNNNRAVQNYSDRSTNRIYYMATYLNEAFSMAAEHLIFGPEGTADRLDYRYGDFVDGRPLTYWGGGSGTLEQYSNSYLLGQYFRTRYAQLKNDGTDGSAFFKTLLEARQNETYGDTLAYIAKMLGASDKQALVRDFWAAVYCNQPSGLYGFGGEDWTKDIYSPLFYLDTNNQYIYNGGAAAYELDASKTYQLYDIHDLTFIAISDAREGGSCGEDMTWTITNTAGVPSLILTGSGKIDSAPWQNYAGQIVELRIPEGVTAFPADAFAGFTALTDVRYDGTKAQWDALRATLPESSPLKTARVAYLKDPLIKASKITPDRIDISVYAEEGQRVAAAAYQANGQFLGCDFQSLLAGTQQTLSLSGRAVTLLRLMQLGARCTPLAAATNFPLN